MEYLIKLSDQEGCISMPSTHKLPERNNQPHYLRHMKKLVTGIGFDQKRHPTLSAPVTKECRGQCYPKDDEDLNGTYEHPYYPNMTCVNGFNPGIPPSAHATQDSGRLQHQTLSPDQYSQPAKTTTQPSDILTQATNLNSQLSSDSQSEQKLPAKATAKPYPSDIVDTLNHTILTAVTNPETLSKVSEFIEYNNESKTITTTYLYSPLTKVQLESKLNITISDATDDQGKRKQTTQQSPSKRPRVFTQKVTWRRESTVGHISF